ncbi:MAG: NAD(+)/NADH kinase [Bacteroidales bacterium]|nr:NAD(+)/NADH kinase [Bacteroidales bacterium]
MSNTTSKQHLLFVVNPVSGIGRQKKIEEVVQENLDLDRFTYDVRYTERIHHGTDITREALAQQTYDAVVAVGGDGSVNDVVTGLQGSSLPMGIIPCGSGNGLARNLKIPLQPAAAVKLLNQFYVDSIDTITVNDLVFASIAGIGFDALVARKMKLAKKRGLPAYTNIILTDYPNYKEQVYHMEIDGKEVVRKAWFISFANSNQFGYNTAIAPLARLDDGLIDVCIVDKIPLVHLPLTAPLVYLNHFELSQHVEIFKAHEVRVLDNDYRWVNIDGEGIKVAKELHFVNHHKTLNIICRDPSQKVGLLGDIEQKIENLERRIESRL